MLLVHTSILRVIGNATKHRRTLLQQVMNNIMLQRLEKNLILKLLSIFDAYNNTIIV